MRRGLVLTALFVTINLSGTAARAADECTGTVFLHFRDSVGAASSLDAVLPLLAAGTRKIHDVAAAAQRASNLARLKQVSAHTRPKVDSAAVESERCVVKVTAVAPSRKIEKGTYYFESEGGAWKLLSWGWLDEKGDVPIP